MLDNSDKPTKVSYDWGKTWHDEPKEEPKPIIKEIPQDNSNKPRIDHVLFNGKYIPKAEVYEI